MTDEECTRLARVQERWEKVFGNSMPFGFEVGIADLPILERCVELRDQTPLDEAIRERLADGRVY